MLSRNETMCAYDRYGNEQPAGQYAPAGQALHSAVVPLPSVEKLPTPQTPLPLELLQAARQYLPPGQALHEDVLPLPAFEKLPAAHSPLPLDELHPARQYAPAGHGVQEDALSPEVEYDPARHEPEGAVNPVPTQYFPGSQGVQVLASNA